MKLHLRPTGEGDRGQILILTALSLTALLGIAALSIDASFMYDKRSRLHAAADAAAKSGALEVWRNSGVSDAELQIFANNQVAWHGFHPGSTTSVTVHHAPVSGPWAGDEGYVEVIVSEPTATFLGVILGYTGMVPAARAVAGTSSSSNCLITLSGNPSLEVGQAELHMPNCNIAAGGPLNPEHNTTVIEAAGVTSTSCMGNYCDHVDHYVYPAPPPTDPLAGKVPTPATCTGSDISVSGGTLSSPMPWPAGCYNNVHLDGHVAMGAGQYQIYGHVEFENATQASTGTNQAFMYFGPAATFTFHQNTSLSVIAVADPDYDYNGIAIYIDPGNTSDWDMRNSSGVTVVGALYAPNTNLIFANGMGSTSNCSLIVARSLDVRNGEGNLSNNCSDYGGSPLLTISLAE